MLFRSGLNVTETGVVKNSNGKLAMTNNGEGGFTVDGDISNVNGDTTLTNTAGFLTVNGNVQGINNSDIYLDNSGSGIEINGNINANKTAGNGSSVNINNTNGAINLNSTGRVNATKDINVTNSGNGGVNVKGLIDAKNNVNIDNKNSNVVIGDKTDNNNYVKAGNNIDILINNGSLLNYGVEKTLLNAGGDLTMNVNDGTIGLEVGGGCQGAACTGIGPKEGGSRDFTKSINGNIKGKVKASTNKVTKPDRKSVV